MSVLVIPISSHRMSVVSDEGLDTRELRDVLDRVLDKGIVVDLASRLDMMSDEPLEEGSRFIVGSVDADF